jgi:hypothetical protein
MVFVIAVPSYNRPKDCQKTLRLLHKHNLLGITTLFVVDGEYDTYKEECIKAGLNPGNIVIGVKGLVPQRSYIYKHYVPGTRIFFMDDDVEDFIDISGGSADIEPFIQLGFDTCATEKCRMFGFYSVCNPFFMKEKITTDLRHILGCSFGIINTGQEPPIPIDDNCGLKEDYFRTCGYFKADGKVVRINYISMKTKYLKNKGGLEYVRTKDNIKQAAEKLLEMYPDWVTLYTRKTTGVTEIRLKNKCIKKTNGTKAACRIAE